MNQSCDHSPNTLQENQTIAALYEYSLWTQVYIPLGLSFIGLVFTIAFIVLSVIGIRRKKLAIHFYYCLINRSLADVICALALAIVLLSAVYQITTNSHKQKAKTIAAIFTLFIYATFFEATFTLLILLALKIVAIKMPLRYRQLVTLRRIVIVLVITWPLTLLVTALILSPQLIVWLRHHRSYHNCWILYRSAEALLTYIVPAAVFLVAIFMCGYVAWIARSVGRTK